MLYFHTKALVNASVQINYVSYISVKNKSLIKNYTKIINYSYNIEIVAYLLKITLLLFYENVLCKEPDVLTRRSPDLPPDE